MLYENRNQLLNLWVLTFKMQSNYHQIPTKTDVVLSLSLSLSLSLTVEISWDCGNFQLAAVHFQIGHTLYGRSQELTSDVCILHLENWRNLWNVLE